MTTVVVSNDYLIADLRISSTRDTIHLAKENDSEDSDYVFKHRRKTRNDDSPKIISLPKDLSFKYRDAYLLAFAITGSASGIKATISALKEVSAYSNDFRAVMNYVFPDNNLSSFCVIFYFSDGSCVFMRIEARQGKRNIEEYGFNGKPYKVVYGSGRDSIHNWCIGSKDKDYSASMPLSEVAERFADITERELFAIATTSDDYSCLKYSVYGRKENVIYYMVEEPKEVLTQVAFNAIKRTSKLVRELERKTGKQLQLV